MHQPWVFLQMISPFQTVKNSLSLNDPNPVLNNVSKLHFWKNWNSWLNMHYALWIGLNILRLTHVDVIFNEWNNCCRIHVFCCYDSLNVYECSIQLHYYWPPRYSTYCWEWLYPTISTLSSCVIACTPPPPPPPPKNTQKKTKERNPI